MPMHLMAKLFLPASIMLASCAAPQEEKCFTREISDQEALKTLNSSKINHQYKEEDFRVLIEYLDCGYILIVPNKNKEGVTSYVLDEKLRLVYIID